MLAVIIGLVMIVVIAAGILAMVAAPRLLKGDELLTPEGKQTIIRAGQRTREQSAAAAENTVQAVSSLKDRVSSAWSPTSDFLHQQFDRLEGNESDRDSVTAEKSRQEKVFEPTEDEPASHGHNVPPLPMGDAANVGAPRPMPAESGPIPIDDPDAGASGSLDSSAARGADDQATVINLRDTSDEMTPPSAIAPESARRIY